jgi:PAS domain S-box-containing protein
MCIDRYSAYNSRRANGWPAPAAVARCETFTMTTTGANSTARIADGQGAASPEAQAVEAKTRHARSEARFAKLQTLTAALSVVLSRDELARVIVDHTRVMTGADLVVLMALSDDGREFLTLGAAGYPAAVIDRFDRVPADAPVMFADAVRRREAIFIETWSERVARYPSAAETPVNGGNGAAAALPLLIENRPIGALEFGLPVDRTFDSEDRDWLRAVADLCAQALERSRLYEAERAARAAAEAAEASLRESEERFRTVATAAPGLIWQSGTDALRNYFNEPWLAFTGRTLEQELGNGWLDGVHPHDYDRCLQTYLAAFKAREPFEMEYRLRRHDGEYRWVVDQGVPRYAPDGTFLGYIGSCLDITDRKRIEDERRLQAALLDQAYNANFAWEWDGGIVFWNQGAARLYGYGRDDALGRISHELLQTTYPEGFAAVRSALERDGEWQGEIEHIRRDGTRILVESRHQLLTIGDRRIVLEANRDITERRRTDAQLARFEERIRLSEERLRIALRGSPIVVYQQDRELRYTWLYNFPGMEAVLGKTDAEVLPSGEGAALMDVKRRVLETGAVERREIRVTTRHGTVYYDLTVEPVRDEMGAIVGVTGSAVDLTGRREREEQIARLQDLTAALSEAATVDQVVEVVLSRAVPAAGAQGGSVSLLSPDGTTFEIAGSAGMPRHLVENWRRYPVDGPFPLSEAVRTALPVWIECPEEWADRYPESYPDFAASGYQAFASVPLIIEGRVLGGIGYDFAEPRTFGADERAFIVALSQQVTQALDRARLYELERASRASAQAAEARYRDLFERSADAILVVDERGRFQDANPAALDLLGYPREELLGATLTDLAGAEAPSLATIFAGLASEGAWHGEFDLRRKDGASVPIEARATAIQTPTGTAAMFAARDISDRRFLERMQQDFFASISHDLKNPLAALRGQVQLLQRRARRKQVLDAADFAAGLETIQSVGERMTAMIEELVDVAQLRGGNPLRLRRQPTDLVELAKRRVREHQQATTRHTLRFEAQEPSFSGWWDESRLGRVIDNLLTNAIKYSSGGEVAVRLRRETRAGADWAVMTIADHGVGIPAADLPLIFERFRRGSNVLDRFAGTGLGLSGVRRIVVQHGGDVSVDSAEGVGTTVTVALPLGQPPEETGELDT